MVSCKKDRVCTCTSDNGDVDKTTYFKTKKKYVRESCASQQTESFDSRTGNTSTGHKITCELK